jgi:hypothetical protein
MSFLPSLLGPDGHSGTKRSWTQWRPGRKAQRAVLPVEICPGVRPIATEGLGQTAAEEQIHRLIHQVFFPGWPKPARQVVFQAVDEQTHIARVCAQVALAVAARVSGSVCAVDSNTAECDLEHLLLNRGNGNGRSEAAVHNGAVAVHEAGGKLWIVPRDQFLADQRGTALTLHARMSELRRQFDYTLLRAPAGDSSLGALLGQFSDGLILVVQAHVTRRAAVQKLKENLQASNVRVLGAVLSGRTFPIPETIYRKV